jgi:dephospho-CoA kinase
MVLGLSGKIGSGKSTLCELVARDLGFGHSSFGDYVRAIASEKNIEHTRKNLQDLGQNLITENIKKFCLGVLEKANWRSGNSVILDGIRHDVIVKEIKALIVPDSFKLIFLKIEDDEVRKARNSNRDIDWTAADSHVTENQVHNDILMSQADLIVDAQEPLEIQKRKIVKWVRLQS